MTTVQLGSAFRRLPLVNPAAGFVVALGVSAAANFGFHAVVSRALPSGDYGVVTALLALLLAVAVPATAIEVSVTREVAAARGARVSTARLGRVVVVGGGLAALALLALSPLVGQGLRLDGYAAPALLAAHVPVLLVGHVARGILLGGTRYGAAAGMAVAGAVTRLVLGLAAAGAFGAVGAIGATLAAEAVMAVVGCLLARSQCDREAGSLRVGWGAGGLGVAALVGFWLLVGVDTVLARAFLTAEEAATYSAAATLGRAALFAPMALVTIAYTRFTANTETARVELRRWLGLVLLAGISAAGVLAIDPRTLTVLALGESFADSAALVAPLAFVAVGLSVVSLFVHFHLSVCARAALVPWGGVAVAVAAASVWHDSPAQLATVVAASVGATLITGVATLPKVGGLGRRRGRHPIVPVLGGEAQLDVTVVVPFYNPGPQLRENIQKLAEELARTGVGYEIIAVSDGSTDGSARSLAGLPSDVFQLIELPYNQGKGAALRTGLARGRGRYLGFIDADGDLDPALWSPFITLMNLYQPDLVMGSKRHPLSELEYPPLRRLYSWGYQQMTRVLFRMNIRDTQTGIKLVRRDVLARVLPLMVEQRFTFDLELLVIARSLGFGRFFEAPVKVREQFTSTVSLRSVGQMLRDTLMIFARLRLTRRYAPAPAPAPAMGLVSVAATMPRVQVPEAVHAKAS